VIVNTAALPNDVACTCTCERDKHLFCPGPKRLLALDGGGVRGAVTVAFLEEIEAVLARHLDRPVHLGHWFDLIGGTSTGAVIAGALAMGYTTADIKRFYFELAPKVFRRSFLRIAGLRAKFDSRALQHEIESVVGKQTLAGKDLITGFCLVAKRMDTGSPWILANNPRARFWEGKAGKGGFIGNKDYPLANLVRASTAAPFYFDPEMLPIAEGEKPGWFVDGGVTPHNNPSLILFLMAILKAYNMRWTAKPDTLTIVSVGTGSHRDRLVPEELGMGKTTRLAIRALTSLMNDAQNFVLMKMQYLGECLTPWWINAEVETLANENPDGKLFRYLRYDVVLERKWLDDLREKVGPDKFDEALGRTLTDTDIVRLRSMDDPTIIKDLYEIARFAAQDQVKPEHWTGELPRWCGGATPSSPARYMTWHDVGPESAATAWSKRLSVALSYLRSWLVRLFYAPSK
jgi:uncharacterized protein